MAFTSGSAVARAQAQNGSASTTLTTGSFTPTAGEMLYIWVFSFILFGGPTVPTMSGTGGMSGATFTEVVTGTFTLTVRCTLFRAVVPSGTSSTITATWGANQTSRGITVVEVAGADTGGTNGSNSIVQTTGLDTASSATIAPTGLAAFASGSGTLLFSMLTNSGGDASAPEAGWTELYDVNPTTMGAYWYEDADTTPTHTNSASRQYMAIGIEIALAASTATGSGAVTLEPVEVSGSGNQTIDGSGAVVLGAVQAAGVGDSSTLVAGAGAIVLEALEAAGVGFETFTGSGAVAFEPVDATGTGIESYAGAGAITLEPVETEGAGTPQYTGTGAILLGAMIAAGVGAVTFEGAGAVELAAVVAVSTGVVLIYGSGAVVFEPVTVAGAGVVSTVPGIGNLTQGAIRQTLTFTKQRTATAIRQTSGYTRPRTKFIRQRGF